LGGRVFHLPSGPPGGWWLKWPVMAACLALIDIGEPPKEFRSPTEPIWGNLGFLCAVLRSTGGRGA
jgi:hypothetical protein